jgi:putative hydrolase of the HAD superfamily
MAALRRATEQQTMKAPAPIRCVFVDVGGVLLTDGWGHRARRLAATTFKLELSEMQERHELTFDTYEEGKLTLDEYLDRVVFHKKRSFTRAQFRRFMFSQSKPYPEMIELLAQLKARHELKVAVVSNEGRELNAYRIRAFKLDKLADVFISSCFVHLRKPDVDIFRLALDIAQVPASQVVYIDNTPMFAQIATTMGIRSICHSDCRGTRAQLALLGLSAGEEGVRDRRHLQVVTVHHGASTIESERMDNRTGRNQRRHSQERKP